jgi:hypothetical protein
MALRKGEFNKALKNAYEIRSKFAHLLQPIQEQLKHPTIADGDVVRFADEPYLTVAGLVRISTHVIKNYIQKCAKVEHENFGWRNSLPGIIQMEMAPQYWIWKHEGIRVEDATKKLSGFLSQLEAMVLRSEPITDLRELLRKYEKLIGQAGLPYKTQLLTTYILYNSLVNEEHRNKNHSNIFEKYKKFFDDCSIETMLAWMLTGQVWPWHREECAKCWVSYQKTMHRKNNIKIPPTMNVALLVEIASMFLKDKTLINYSEWMTKAILEAAGQKGLQQKLLKAKSEVTAVKGVGILNSSFIK